MAEPPLSDRELRILRGMMDAYEQRRIMDVWLSRRWQSVGRTIIVASAAVVTIVAILQLVNIR